MLNVARRETKERGKSESGRTIGLAIEPGVVASMMGVERGRRTAETRIGHFLLDRIATLFRTKLVRSTIGPQFIVLSMNECYPTLLRLPTDSRLRNHQDPTGHRPYRQVLFDATSIVCSLFTVFGR